MPLKSRHRDSHSRMPEVNLIPMMDVLMTILTFFILLAMTLTTQQKAVNISLPTTDSRANQVKTPNPLIIGLNQQGKLFLGDQPVTNEQLGQQMVTYLTNNPQGAVILKADRTLPYEQVIKVLAKMRDIGGDRVSLALEN